MSVPSHFGRYRVLRPLATGEMGVVYLAEDPLIGRKVAIKGIRFDPHVADEEVRRLQDRFDQEIQIAGTFSHPNIVTLFDVGRQRGNSFIAMEYVDGRNLRAELQANGPMTAASAVELAVPLCHALAYAHERKIIHRDIKPTNILVSSEGVPKITDFGVARLFGSTLTNAGKIFGTPAYMSPEQAVGGELTGASDQFAIAAVLYELLTGERPFKGSSPTTVIYEVIEHHPSAPHEIAPLVPIPISEAVMRGLDKDPANRFEDCSAFAVALEEAAAWSRAHPETAYLEGVPADISEPATVETTGPWIPVDAMQVRAREFIESIWARDLLSTVRSRLRAHPEEPESLATFAAGTISLAGLLMLITWVASANGPMPQSSRLRAADESVQAAEQISNEPGPVSRPTRQGTPPALESEERLTPVTAPAGAAEADDTPSDGQSFTVSSAPGGAHVFLDGKLLDTAAPASIHIVPGGEHTLRLEKEGYSPSTWRFSWDSLTAAHFESGRLHFPLSAEPVEYVEEILPAAAGSWSVELDAPAPEPTPGEPAAPPIETTSGPPPTPATIRRVRAPGEVRAPVKVHHVGPTPTPGNRAAGSVVIEIEVSARGNVVQAKVLRGVDPAVDRAALDAVVRWKYEPTQLAGVPVRVVMTVTLPVSGS